MVSVQESGSDTWSAQSSDTSTDSGTFSENGNGSSGGQLHLSLVCIMGGPTDNSGSSFSAFNMLSGNASDTSFDSTTDSGSDSWSMSELGSFSNFSYAYASVVSSDGGSDNEIVSDSSTDSFSGAVSNNQSSGDTGSAGGVSGYASFNASSGEGGGSSDSMIVTDYGQSQQTVNTTSTWSDYQAGSFSGDSWALSSVSDSSGGSDTWTEMSNDTASASGAQTINAGLSYGNGGTVSGYSGLTVSVGGSASSSETFGGTDTARVHHQRQQQRHRQLESVAVGHVWQLQLRVQQRRGAERRQFQWLRDGILRGHLCRCAEERRQRQRPRERLGQRRWRQRQRQRHGFHWRQHDRDDSD